MVPRPCALLSSEHEFASSPPGLYFRQGSQGICKRINLLKLQMNLPCGDLLHELHQIIENVHLIGDPVMCMPRSEMCASPEIDTNVPPSFTTGANFPPRCPVAPPRQRRRHWASTPGSARANGGCRSQLPCARRAKACSRDWVSTRMRQRAIRVGVQVGWRPCRSPPSHQQ